MIYLDNAATTKPSEAAIDAAEYCLRTEFGNPSSLHRLGLNAEKLLDFSRDELISALGGQGGSVVFTSGATESNNLAVFGLAENYGRRKKRIVTTAVEHPSVAEAMKRLTALGYTLETVMPDENGRISEETLVSSVDENTCLISCMYVNNETGAVLPVENAFSRIKKLFPDCITHCDFVQGFMKLPVKVKNLSADAVSVSGHKVHAPKGVGALWFKKGVRIAPTLFGGGQQSGLRSGTEPVPLIYSFAKAVEELEPTVAKRLEHAMNIYDYAVSEILGIDGAVINSSRDGSPYIISMALKGIKSETLLHFLESKDIYVSSGSACSKGKKSAVLKAFGYPESVIDSTVRISTCAATSKEDIDSLTTALKEAQKSLIKTNGRR